MKKLYILLLFVMSLLSINETNALWYGKTAISYTDSPVIQECPSDWDTTGWYATWYTKDRAVTTSAWTSPITSGIAVSPTWTMYCLKWDASNPTGSISYSDWWTNAISRTVTMSLADAWWSKLSSYTLQVSESTNNPNFTTWWAWTTVKTVTWINSNTKNDTYGYTPVNNTAYRFRVIIYDVAWNTTTIVWTQITKIDQTVPTISDITNSNPTNLLATTSYNYGISVSINSGSPIVSVSWRKENSADNLTTAYSLTSIPWTQIWDIHQVDNYRTWNGWRAYTFRITQICDEAWNCWSWTQDYIHYVYANTLNIWTKSVTTNQLTSGIADGISKNLIVTLNDIYWNDIIQATWIWRTIDINWNVTNRMYLNQINRSWAKSVYVNTTTNPSVYSNTSLSTTLSSFVWETSTDGTYPYTFKFYTPTSNQDNGPVSDPNAEFIINSMNFDVNGSLWTVSWQSIWSSTITAKMSPMYYSEIQWEMKTDWIIEWAVQSWIIMVKRNGTIVPTNRSLYLEFWSWDTNVVNPKLNLLYWTSDTNVTSIVSEWKSNGTNTIFKNPFSVATYDIYTKLLMQTWATINDIQNSYFATHIWYDISDPNGTTINPLYNSDVYWKESYFWATWTWNTYWSSIKIVWETYSQSYNEILDWQEW